MPRTSATSSRALTERLARAARPQESGEAVLSRYLGDWPSLRPLRRVVRRAAPTDATVLVLGEAGSGRSRAAQAIHAASARVDGPLLEVDAATLPPDLFEAELFGHRAGAFTGAARDRAGRVERAAGGTLVLDHVEELPVAAQPKLLRLLGERRYAPLGGAERAADVRFVAIGAEDLGERVRRGRFREDLFHRLAVVTVQLPPLRARRAELPDLVPSIVAELAAKLGRAAPPVAARALEWMARYPWPGNLRELRNLLERELVLRAGERLDPPPRGEGAPPRSLAEVEREAIVAALAWTRGRQAEAARLLGISRKTLWEKRRRHGLP